MAPRAGIEERSSTTVLTARFARSFVGRRVIIAQQPRIACALGGRRLRLACVLGVKDALWSFDNSRP